MKSAEKANWKYQVLEGVCYIIAIVSVMDNSVFSFVGEGVGVLIAIVFTIAGIHFNRKNEASYNANILVVGIVVILSFVAMLLYSKFK
ncbi:hypothetical protein [Neolewinella agarilytica]|uniref:Uncharacterized protein n=1 Tax=Neolewinella agarilytica TaxID=478744 RepID=A0A1H9GF58_9BACT|nr:hypothetical protein [Neolewinella agarilytica]SEQ48732.1 hypothetical protein SAMN05444359_110156 [Neolewinella agarilytica]